MPRRLAALLALAAGLLLTPPAAAQDPALDPGGPAAPESVPAFDGDALWIWLMDRTEGGSAERIAARARRHGLELVILKAGGERVQWTQLNPELIATLRAAGLRVCGYHFVFGRRPLAEARVSARIARTGADCLVIDAETDYKGRYWEAERYMRALRRMVGADYPIGFTSFPYVHYHSTVPYSVFLAPGAADFNVPQMYWRAIGTSVDQVFETTYRHNRIYRKPIYPLGQTWMQPPRRQVLRFRALAEGYGATGVSWWSWQETTARDFRNIAAPVPRLRRPPPDPGYPLLGSYSSGDIVVQLQRLLLAAGARLRVTARMDRRTTAAVAAFKRRNRLGRGGYVTAATWERLLELEPAAVTWRARRYAVARAAR
ncbi:MAG: peptidoglycan-binding protein [Solirubrobacterales bacterium]|nr:peptidoglycan-binding protein [Solirubrobacterales bacterium]